MAGTARSSLKSTAGLKSSAPIAGRLDSEGTHGQVGEKEVARDGDEVVEPLASGALLAISLPALELADAPLELQQPLARVVRSSLGALPLFLHGSITRARGRPRWA